MTFNQRVEQACKELGGNCHVYRDVWRGFAIVTRLDGSAERYVPREES